MPALEQNSAIGPNCCLGFLDDVADVLLLPDVAFERGAIDRGGDGFGARQIEIGDHHLGRTGAMKGLAQRPADAVGAAGDDHDFAGHLHRTHPLFEKELQVRTRSSTAV